MSSKARQRAARGVRGNAGPPHGTLTRQGLVLHKKKLSIEDLQIIEEKLIVHIKGNSDKFADPLPINAYINNEDHIIVPKSFEDICKIKKVRNVNDKKGIQKFKYTTKLRDYQKEPARAIIKALKETGMACTWMGTGTGKTAVACYVLTKMRVKVLWLSHNRDMAIQSQERINQFTDASVTFMMGSEKYDKDAQICVATLQTLSGRLKKGKLTYDDLSMYDFLIVDEVHRIATRGNTIILQNVCTKYSLGISATPTRPDGGSELIWLYIGPIVHDFIKAPNLDQIKFVNIIKYTGNKKQKYRQEFKKTLANGDSSFDHQKTMKYLSKDKDRNKFIAGIINGIFELTKDRVLLGLSDNVAPLEAIKRYLIKEHDFKKSDIGLLYGKVSKIEREKAKKKKVILATTPIGGTGFDVAAVDTLMFITSRSGKETSELSRTQFNGRNLRKEHDWPPLIVDINDSCHYLATQVYGRIRTYKKDNYIIIKSNDKLHESIHGTEIEVPEYYDDSNSKSKSNSNSNSNSNTKKDIFNVDFSAFGY